MVLSAKNHCLPLVALQVGLAQVLRYMAIALYILN
jgi:hypothetical protein